MTIKKRERLWSHDWRGFDLIAAPQVEAKREYLMIVS